jgi:hypothetical protein
VVSGSLSFASHFRLVLVRGELRGNFFNGEAEEYRDRSKNCEQYCTVFLTLVFARSSSGALPIRGGSDARSFG